MCLQEVKNFSLAVEYLKLVSSPHIQLGEVVPLKYVMEGSNVALRWGCLQPKYSYFTAVKWEHQWIILIRFKNNDVCQCQIRADG